jgi:hypothetical protein
MIRGINLKVVFEKICEYQLVLDLLVNICPLSVCSMDFNQQNDYVVETSLVGTVMNGLSHLHGCKDHDQFIINLIRGLGGNLNMKSRLEFTKEVMHIFNLI